MYLNFAGMTAGGESDIGSVDGMMPDDVEAAYQVILVTLFIYATTGKLCVIINVIYMILNLSFLF